MRRLKGWYAHELNRRRQRVGPVFDGRFHSGALVTETHARAAIIYLALNPARAGLRDRPELWPFGSHRAHIGVEPRPGWLEPVSELGIFQDAGSYRDGVDEAAALIRQCAVGSDRRV